MEYALVQLYDVISNALEIASNWQSQAKSTAKLNVPVAHSQLKSQTRHTLHASTLLKRAQH